MKKLRDVIKKIYDKDGNAAGYYGISISYVLN